MAEIEDYIQAAFYRHYPNHITVPDGFHRRDELLPHIEQAVSRVLSMFKAQEIIDISPLASDLFDDWRRNQVIYVEGDKFAGLYYRFSMNQLNHLRVKKLEGNEINLKAEAIGERFYIDVFGGYRGVNPLTRDLDVRLAVPASDRVVTLNHNQIDQFDDSFDDLVSQLEKDNGVPDHPGLRERLLGQVRAGRELLKSGNFKAYLLYVTLIKALGEIIERYKGSAIAMVSASLIDLIVKQVFQAS